MKGRALAALCVAAVAAPACAADAAGWRKNGVPLGGDPAMTSDGDFGAMLVSTDDWPGFLERWNTPTPGFLIVPAKTVAKGEPLVTTIVFTGCRSDAAGRCSVTADFKVIDPAGKVYADRPGATVWAEAPPTPRDLQLSVDGLGLSLDPPDAPGTYVIMATVVDQVAHKTLTLKSSFEGK